MSCWLSEETIDDMLTHNESLDMECVDDLDRAFRHGAAVAFGLIGMAQAINARRLRRMCDYCHGTGEYLDKGYHGDDPTWEVCGDCNGHGATWARPEVTR